MTASTPFQLAIIGGGPAGLMAAEVACAAGLSVEIYEGKGSVGRKFLLAGKGGLNLTHSETFQPFVARYGDRADQVGRWLQHLDNNAVRAWARELGVDTMVGTSGRVFPSDLKAAPLLRGWVRRLRERGVRFHVNHYCIGIDDLDGRHALRFRTPLRESVVRADAVVLAMGGGSWPDLGSDGQWVDWLQQRVDVAPLKPSNCGFDVAWTQTFAQRFAGQPMKSVVVTAEDLSGKSRSLQGEFVITAHGIEGSVIYALSPALRDVIDRDGSATLRVDLSPARDLSRLTAELARQRGGRSLTEHVRRTIGIDGVKMGLLYEFVPRADLQDVEKLAAAIKSLPIKLLRARPLAEAISSAGGIRFGNLDERLMIKSMPGIFCAGEMIDWEAPTGGYLLNACLASGKIAGEGVAMWLDNR